MSNKPILALAFLPLLTLEQPSRSPQLFEEVEPHMGTLVQIKLYARDAQQAKSASRLAFARIAQLDNTLSDYNPDSELNRLCRRGPGGPVPVSRDLFRVLEASQKLSAETDGAFDLTVGPLSHLWREARRSGRVPDANTIRAATVHCGYRKLSLDQTAQTASLTEAGMQLDAGAIGKGYAADEALAVLRQQGIESALISVSGDLAFSDAPPGQTGWHIGVDFFSSTGTPRRIVLSLKNGAASTSGDSEQHLDVGATRYSHIINPLTGLALTKPVTATVIARQGIEADPEATALCVLGPEQGLRFVEKYTSSAALIAVKQPLDVRESRRFRQLATRPPLQEFSNPGLGSLWNRQLTAPIDLLGHKPLLRFESLLPGNLLSRIGS